MNISAFLIMVNAHSSRTKKLEMIAEYISKHFDKLEYDNRRMLRLLEPCLELTREDYEERHDQDALSEYTFALCKTAEYYIRDEQTWRATPLLSEALSLTRGKEAESASEKEWKHDTLATLAELHDQNGRRQQAHQIREEAAQYGPKPAESSHYLKYDPVEDSEAYIAIKDDMEHRLYDMLKDEPRGMGFCFRYWSAKRDLLEQEYGISWRTPSMMNPRVHFD